MQYSSDGMHLTEQFEQCRLIAYPDSKGVPTIGWGHTLHVTLGMTCSQSQADDWLRQDVQIAANAVNTMVRVTLTQHEYDALVDFVFNCGAHNFYCSTMLTKLNNGDYAGAANEFDKWDMCGGQHLAGLLRRRQAETQEFKEQ